MVGGKVGCGHEDRREETYARQRVKRQGWESAELTLSRIRRRMNVVAGGQVDGKVEVGADRVEGVEAVGRRCRARKRKNRQGRRNGEDRCAGVSGRVLCISDCGKGYCDGDSNTP